MTVQSATHRLFCVVLFLFVVWHFLKLCRSRTGCFTNLSTQDWISTGLQRFLFIWPRWLGLSKGLSLSVISQWRSYMKPQWFTPVYISSPLSIPAAYIQFPGLWDCETGSSPHPLPPWRFLHGLQHRTRLLWWRINDAEQLQIFVVLLFFFFFPVHAHTSLSFLETNIFSEYGWGILSEFSFVFVLPVPTMCCVSMLFALG